MDGKLLAGLRRLRCRIALDDGHDPRFTAIHKNDYTNTALQFYDKRAVTTGDGF